jgi:hypothetical protein
MRLADPASDQEVERISKTVTCWSPELLLLFLSGDSAVEMSAVFFGLACTNKWSMPIVVVRPMAKPNDVVELLRLGASDVVTTPLRSKEVIRRLSKMSYSVMNPALSPAPIPPAAALSRRPMAERSFSTKWTVFRSRHR